MVACGAGGGSDAAIATTDAQDAAIEVAAEVGVDSVSEPGAEAAAEVPDVAKDTPAGDEPPVDVAGDQGGGACPSSIEPNSGCTGDMTCNIGQECCCGACHPSMVCTCGGGKWGCYATDACLIPPDTCAPDVVADPAGEVAPDAADEVPPNDVTDVDTLGGPCRSSNDCTGGQYCLGPDDPQPCGICQQPPTPCGGDIDCTDGTVCDQFKASCPCGYALTCVPRCGPDAGCGVLEACHDQGRLCFRVIFPAPALSALPSTPSGPRPAGVPGGRPSGLPQS